MIVFLIAFELNTTTLWAFYGSCCNQINSLPDSKWGIGLVYSLSNTISGPWIRYDNNPLNWTSGVENPVVTITSKGYYLVTFCVNLYENYGCGFSWSLDGVNWTDTQVFPASEPIPYCRVPYGLLENDDGTFTLFYTASDQQRGAKPIWCGE